MHAGGVGVDLVAQGEGTDSQRIASFLDGMDLPTLRPYGQRGSRSITDRAKGSKLIGHLIFLFFWET